MPPYECKCAKYRKRFNLTLGIKEHNFSRTKCPNCSPIKFDQLISSFPNQTISEP
jgi:hypothetical protein